MFIYRRIKLIKGRRSDNCVWQRVPNLNYSVQEEVVSYSCPGAENISYSWTRKTLCPCLECFHVRSLLVLICRRFRGFTHSILSLLLINLHISSKSALGRLSFKVVKYSLFNLSSYSSFPKPVGILVALLWTLSTSSMSACRCGFYACTSYSKCGLTRDTNRSFHSLRSLLSYVLLSIDSILYMITTL